MKRFPPLLLLALWLAGCSETKAEQPQPEGQKLRIVSWNLNWFPGRKDKTTDEEAKAHKAAAQDALKEMTLEMFQIQKWQLRKDDLEPSGPRRGQRQI